MESLRESVAFLLYPQVMANRERVDLQDSLSFRAWRCAPQVMTAPHSHTDIELNLPLNGTLRYFFAGRFQEVPAGGLAAFWAGIPHRLVAVEPYGMEYLCLTLPLGWFLSWGIEGVLTDRFLAGELLFDSDPLDGPLFARWAQEVCEPTTLPEARRIVLLEVEARLRRLAGRIGSGEGRATPGRGGSASAGGQVERIASFLSRHFADPELSAERVAEAVGLHPNYTLTVFREGCGMTLWDYLTRLRISHAQRLLLTTDWTVEQVARESGFGSMSRFFAVFRRHCHCTPRQYRQGAESAFPPVTVSAE